jgi:tRNA(adenine34) deaminase
VGAVVAHGPSGRVVARAHNTRVRDADPTAHAEIVALREAARRAGTWRLDDHVLVATVEPCPMCAGAAWAARLARVVFGTPDPKAGAMGSLYNLAADPRLNHELTVAGGVLADECAMLLRDFFSDLRE